jgi:hypothetical protein
MIWSELRDSTQDPSVRDAATKMLRGLKAQEDEMHLDELAEQYEKRFGHYPASTNQLRDAGLIGGIPLDPEGYPYVFGADGKSRLSPQSRFVIPPDPRTPPAPIN